MPVAKKQPTRKTLKRGRDWDAWAWKYHADDVYRKANEPFWPWTEEVKPVHGHSVKGKWVRVKFAEVPAAKKGE